MDLIGLLVFLIIIGLAFWAVSMISGAFGIPGPIVTVIYVVLVIIVVIFLLGLVGYGPGVNMRFR